MKAIWVVVLLAACAPESASRSPKPPRLPQYEDVRVDRVTANLPGIGPRTWVAVQLKYQCRRAPCGGWVQFYDAETRRSVVINDDRWIVLKEFVRYDRYEKRGKRRWKR